MSIYIVNIETSTLGTGILGHGNTGTREHETRPQSERSLTPTPRKQAYSHPCITTNNIPTNNIPTNNMHTNNMHCLLLLSIYLLCICTPALSIPSTYSLTNKHAVVTGGTAGIGRAIVAELLAFNCTVLTCSRSATALAALETEFNSTRLRTTVADVATDEGRADLLTASKRELGETLDILVNNGEEALRQTRR